MKKMVKIYPKGSIISTRACLTMVLQGEHGAVQLVIQTSTPYNGTIQDYSHVTFAVHSLHQSPYDYYSHLNESKFSGTRPCSFLDGRECYFKYMEVSPIVYKSIINSDIDIWNLLLDCYNYYFVD